jgi:hypothetical protein
MTRRCVNMAEYRQTYCKMWSDTWFSELELDEKLLWSYFFTNEHTSVAGIYEISPKTMAFETGIKRERVEEILLKFRKVEKLRYEDGILWIFNMPKYQGSDSPKVVTRIRKDVIGLPNSQIKRDYIKLYSINTVSIPIPKNGSDTDTDTETEMDTERETEKIQKQKSALFSLKDAENLYCQVTKHPTVPGGMYEYLEKILDLLQKFGSEETKKRLQSAWEGWCKSKRKDTGMAYSRTNPAWIDYAIVGEVPKGDQKTIEQKHKSFSAEIAKELSNGRSQHH